MRFYQGDHEFCRRCGHSQTGSPGLIQPDHTIADLGNDRLRLMCRRCGYVWYRKKPSGFEVPADQVPTKIFFPGRYIWNIFLSLDQLGNVLRGGDPDETISSRLGKLKRKCGGTIPWTRPISKIIDAGLDQIDPGHSIDAIEEDEGKNAAFIEG